MRKVRSSLGRLKRRTLGHSEPGYRLPRPDVSAAHPGLTKPLLIACRPGFDQDLPGSGALIRLGLAHGWAQACGPAKLVPVAELLLAIDRQPERPAVMMSEFEFIYLRKSEAKRLREVDLFVWVGIHPSLFGELRKHVPLTNHDELDLQKEAYSMILTAEPKFVFNSVGQGGAAWFQGWRDDGLKWETIWHAANPERYFPEPSPQQFGHIKMAYVGGYWAEKAQGYELYLRPWENILVTYGNQSWPYKGYAGQLDEEGERQLYSTAEIIPLVTGPFGWMMAELTERYFKTPACRAFCIADHNPALREVFSEHEMLQAQSPEHFHELIRDYLDGKIDAKNWAERGYRAVQERHLYKHRALQIKTALEKVRRET